MSDKSPPSTALLATGRVAAPPSASKGDSSPAAGSVPSDALLRGRKAVAITHNGMRYTLQATKLGKLILTK
jgi:hemin uptake protein HemP